MANNNRKDEWLYKEGSIKDRERKIQNCLGKKEVWKTKSCWKNKRTNTTIYNYNEELILVGVHLAHNQIEGGEEDTAFDDADMVLVIENISTILL